MKTLMSAFSISQTLILIVRFFDVEPKTTKKTVDCCVNL